MISAAASTNSPKNSREPTEISLLSDFTFLSLCRDHAGRLREKLARFVNAAFAVKVAKFAPAKPGPRGKAAPVPSNRDQVQAIREWAKASGYEVSTRGRISKAIQEAFDAAH
jgi:hypothetical protein